ncbi:hypothetical protein [Pseudonocardia sp. NPDC049154]|uniref:hypothetical protein n=1 Tax=Pseudonocardia sp. NPDC049154 TaxID=3155501 RepID=UPI0033E928EE
MSRVALRVLVADGVWHIELLNGNGCVVHAYGLRPREQTAADRGRALEIRWPRVAVRLIGSPGWIHWVLLESGEQLPPRRRPPRTAGSTETSDLPLPLTERQIEVLRAVFAVQLAWPPSLQPPLLLKQASASLGRLGRSSIADNLRAARARAVALGMPDSSVGAADPEILHTLVAHGYLPVEDVAPA